MALYIKQNELTVSLKQVLRLVFQWILWELAQ